MNQGANFEGVTIYLLLVLGRIYLSIKTTRGGKSALAFRCIYSLEFYLFQENKKAGSAAVEDQVHFRPLIIVILSTMLWWHFYFLLTDRSWLWRQVRFSVDYSVFRFAFS